uniref:Uncharacterized protein n=1 Tax=Meloidogyne incognita TaxID=6306 RepID=A0A914L1L4_MELIC
MVIPYVVEFEEVACPADLKCVHRCFGPVEWNEPIICSKTRPVVTTEAEDKQEPQFSHTLHFYIFYALLGLILVSILILAYYISKHRPTIPGRPIPKSTPTTTKLKPKPIFISAV